MPNGVLVKVVGVTCPRHGDKVGLMQHGVLIPFPFPMEQHRAEQVLAHCFECKAVGINRRCTIIMEMAEGPLG
jgi:hypothetical protein